MEKLKIKVGVGVMIFKEGKVLLGKRNHDPGKGEYSFPGGNLEYMESFDNCVRREVKEETGLDIKNIQFLCVSNALTESQGHFIDIGFTAEYVGGELRHQEVDNREGWQWYTIDRLPEPLFGSCNNYIKAYSSGEVFFDTKM